MSKVSFVLVLQVTGSVLALSIPAKAESPASAPSAPAAEAKGPERAWLEAGVFGGALFLSKQHALFRGAHESFKSPVPEIGARLAVLPWAYFGAEFEGMAGPARTNGDRTAGVWALRGHALAQLPGERLTPFILVGGGALGAASNPTGRDSDPAIHFGAGLKLAVDDFLGLRLDVRDVLSQKYPADQGTQAHHPEVLLGASFNLDFSSHPAPPPPVADRDSDSVADADDACPDQAGPAPRGCPPPKDSDGDGFIDDKDACPSDRGVAPVGCPDLDPDHDCVPAPADECPTQPGLAPSGCPDPDPDRDGVKGANDQCPAEVETKNGFQDEDGCPDVLPEKVKKYSGVIPGIEFDLGKATVRPASLPTLDEAAGVLKEFAQLRVSISGHTDNVGDRQRNVDLSRQRADAVKAYLVSKGVAAERIETRGAGPDEPVADNKLQAGRQKNRRIEFKLLSP